MKKATILVVEDHGPRRTALAGHLDRLGENVMLASNGAEAMAVLDYRDDVALLVIGTLAAGGMSATELRNLATERLPRLETLFGPGAHVDDPALAIWVSDDMVGQIADRAIDLVSKLRN